MDKVEFYEKRIEQLYNENTELKKSLETVKGFLSAKRNSMWWNPEANEKTDQTCNEILDLLEKI